MTIDSQGQAWWKALLTLHNSFASVDLEFKIHELTKLKDTPIFDPDIWKPFVYKFFPIE